MRPYYEQSGVTIYHGDCRDVMEEWEGLRTHSFDLLLTDPPYGIAFAAQPTKWQRGHGEQAQGWDDERMTEAVNRSRALAKHSIIWGGNYYDLPPARCLLTWFKPDAPPSMGSVEFAWTNLNQNTRQIQHSISATNGERVRHPTQKPEAVMRWCLLQAPASVKTVLDPFMGSGTTLVAAKRLGKQAVGIEREEKYCEIAAKRLSQEVLPLGIGA